MSPAEGSDDARRAAAVDSAGGPDGHRPRGIRRCRLGLGVTVLADHQPRRVVDGGLFAIPDALRTTVGGFADPRQTLDSRLVAVGLTMATLAVQLPLYRGSDAARTAGVGLRVISANLREGQADPDYLVRSAREQADVLAFQELTREEVDRLSAAGLDATFPYRWLDPRAEASGVGVWSRLPMHATKRIEGYAYAFMTARIQVAGIPIDPTVVVAHVAGPWPQPIDAWRQDFDRLPVTLQEVAEQTGRGS